MNVKEQESQLSLSLNLRIMVSVFVYLILVVFVSYRLFVTSKVPKLIEISSDTSVPSLKTDNFGTLRQSIKKTIPVSGPQVIRPEPFD